MKKLLTKAFGVVLSLAVAVSFLVPTTALAADSIYAPEKITVYMTSSHKNWSSNTSFSVSGLTKDQKIKKSNVKSSKKSVVALNYLEKSSSKYSYAYDYYDENREGYEYGNESYSYYIGLELKKAGTSTISYKVGKKTYKTIVDVKKYTNPLKTVTIKGINSGKNIAKKLKTVNNTNLSLKKTVKDAGITIKTNSGWKVTSMYVSVMEDTDNGYKTNTEEYAYHSNGRSTVKLNVDSLDKTKSYVIQINSTNTKTGGTITSFYYINY